MQKLNLPEAKLRIRNVGGKHQVFDEIRRKYVALTPEEWVRQHFVNFLIVNQNIAKGLLAIEMLVKVNNLSQRADMVAFNKRREARMIVECKAPGVPITRMVFAQAARYHSQLQVEYLVVTNGMQHYCARLTDNQGNYELLKAIPTGEEINN